MGTHKQRQTLEIVEQAFGMCVYIGWSCIWRRCGVHGLGRCHPKQRSKVWALSRAGALTFHICVSGKSCTENEEDKAERKGGEGELNGDRWHGMGGVGVGCETNHRHWKGLHEQWLGKLMTESDDRTTNSFVMT